ncbi:hypothetical protein [Diplocloster modestus]|uniref:Uncharacterized protein n=1 Tax=Diplocloster modestus TaxID=2850322 RepID=A0ABS6K2Q5_9FIRM|nr:hypothetical protein [Diplocloster modestus]MBU9724680.1 hypothetical protein [Diplocloster modestus]
MLEEKDLSAIAEIVHLQAVETENLVLDEMGRTQEYLDKRIGDIQKNLEELQQYYRITKLEKDNTTLLLKMIETLQKDVEKLKQNRTDDLGTALFISE